MNFIIFGGEGFIGTHFHDYFDKFHGNIMSYDIIRSSASIFQDVRKPINISGKFAKDDIIINLAAVHRTPGHPDHEYFETNIKGAENVCSFAEKNGINNIIFTSSIAPYGPSEDLKSEDTLPTPNSPYGISKLAAEYIHKMWQLKDEKRKLLILRPGVVFGKGENGNFTRLYQAIKSGKFFYPGRKNTIKACIYVKDLIQLTFQIFDSYKSGIQTYNFTYEPAPTIQEIVETMCEVIDKAPPKLLVNGNFLKATAKTLNLVGFGKMGIHPDRVKKLMVSTNISGKKLAEKEFKFNLKSAIEDWYNDCQRKALY